MTNENDKQTSHSADEPQPIKRETSLLSGGVKRPQPVQPLTPPATEQPGPSQTARLTGSWRLLLQIGSQNQTTVGVEVRDKIVIGRGDPVANFYPDLDLTPYGGQEGGVSRRHAAVLRDDEHQALYLEDLGSTNGTRINGFLLESHRRYRLCDGDEIELGRVRVTLRFARSPF